MKLHRLTTDQQIFASDNHYLINVFLNEKNLNEDEYYDVVVFGYLLAVQECSENSIKNFREIAWERMQESVIKDSFKEPDLSTIDELLPYRKQAIYNSSDNLEAAIPLLTCFIPKGQEILRLKAAGYTYEEISDLENFLFT